MMDLMNCYRASRLRAEAEGACIKRQRVTGDLASRSFAEQLSADDTLLSCPRGRIVVLEL